MLPYQLTVLGPPELRGPDGDPIRLRTRKHLALLIYLAVEPNRAHRRDRLACTFWPGVELEEARHSLATALSVLRSELSRDAFDSGRDTVRLLGGHLLTDLPSLLSEDPDGIDVPRLRPFLEDFELNDAPDFQLWKDAQHVRLLPLLQRGLGRRIEESRRRGDAGQLEVLGERLAKLDPLNEEGVRALLEARALAGDRIGALRLFDRWRAMLAEELGAEPPLELQRLAERLRRGRWEGGAPSALVAPVPTEQWKERVFIGRGVEFGRCYALWETARTATPRHLLIRGESGIGKTTLVERFATTVALEGASVARVQCYQLERELPFGVIGSLVTRLLDLPGASTTPPPQLAELARLIPKVRQRYPTLPAPLPTEGESARIMFTEAVMALVAALAQEHPVVLVVDDIHLADATSLAVLHLILRRIEDLPLMVILTSSSALEAETPNARRFVDNARSINLTKLALGPLHEGEATALLEAEVTPAEALGPAVQRAIVGGAHGNPMVLELLIEDWRRHGDGCFALTLGSMAVSQNRPPREAFRRLVEETLAALDPESRSVVELAAMLGKRLNDLSMYTMVDLSVTRTMRAMTTLTTQRLFRDAGNHLEFASELVRSQCYMAMAGPLRRMLHGLVADRLLAEDGAEEPIPGLEIAWHLVRADRLAEAIPYLLAGGRESIRRGAPHEADLALSTGLPALTGDARRAAILLLAEARQELGRWEDSLRVLDLAEEPFSESEASEREVMRIVARRWLGQLTDSALDKAAHRLCDIAESGVDIEVRVKALSAMPYLLTQTRDTVGLSRLGAAIASVEPCSMDDFQRLHLLLAKAWREDQLRNTETARRLIDEAVALINAIGAGSTVAIRILVGAGILYVEEGRYEQAVPLLERAFRMARKIDNSLHIAAASAALALAQGRLGHTKEQLEWAQLAINALLPDDGGIVALAAAYERGLALVFGARNADALTSLSEVEARFSNRRPLWVTQAWKLMKADIHALAGETRKALSLAKQATSGKFDEVLVNDFAGPFVRWRALTALRDGTVVESIASMAAYLTNLEKYHAKDQVEILASIAMLETRAGIDSSARSLEVERRLQALPDSVRTLVRRLGVLPESGNALGGLRGKPHRP